MWTPPTKKKESEKKLWYRCNYQHRSRDSVSPVHGMFFLSQIFTKKIVKSKEKEKISPQY